MSQHKSIVALIVTTLCTGLLVFAFYNNWIIINLPIAPHTIIQQHDSTVSKQQLSVSYFKQNQLKREHKELMWSASVTDNLTHLTQTWLSLLDEEEVLLKKTTLQSIAITENNEKAIISFDRPPFNTDDATFAKLMIIESLLQSIKENVSTLKTIQFLVHHQTINDYHLDFSRPWPISGFIQTKPDQNIFSSTAKTFNNKTVTIMLDPAGDAQNTGRIIGDNFERGITLQYAQALKKKLEILGPNLRIILTRFPGETLEPLQNAAFSNRLHADFYLSINFYPAKKGLSQCYLYNFVYDPITDFWQKKHRKLAFLSYNNAHLHRILPSYQIAQSMFNELKNFQKQGLFSLRQVIGAPFKPLIGVQAIGVGCEIGLHSKDDWQMFVEPLAQALIGTLIK